MVFGQDAEHPLMLHFARHLRELGERVGPSFLAFARSGTAEELATELSTWPSWYDISPYDGETIPFFKRAQIAAADLALAGLTDASDLARLTLFADNLVPHVLRLDGILEFDDDLVQRIDAGTLIEHDSPEEVEIRACALHAVELLVQAHGHTTATAVDNVALAPRRRAPVQGAPPPPGPHDGLLAMLVELEGFHALKHALRFGAVIESVTGDPEELERMRAQLAPDLVLPPIIPGDAIVTVARRPDYDLEAALHRNGPVVYLEEPRHLGNLGAAIRVAAAADAAAVLSTADPWQPGAIRGGAGLQFALPVLQVDEPPRSDRPLIAIDPDGEERTVPAHAVLAFGSERHGLSEDLKARADALVRIPMRGGVSSLNLATAVAATLYGLVRC